jgi:fumarylacetoacetate (FAA) hydrolase
VALWGVHNNRPELDLVDGGFVSIGWDRIGDLRAIGADRDEMKAALVAEYPHAPARGHLAPDRRAARALLGRRSVRARLGDDAVPDPPARRRAGRFRRTERVATRACLWQARRMRLVTYSTEASPARVGELDGEQVHELAAGSMIEWLNGQGRARTGATEDLADVMLHAPVPDPPSVRDFFAFEGHVGAGFRLRGSPIPDEWYEAPVFYFSNPASVRGPGEPVSRPQASTLLDFELEVAAVIGGDGEIAGFTLMNDWSARDLQRREMAVGLGPAKGKDFATSLGPWLVTPDELPYSDGRLNIEARVLVNGEELSVCQAAEQHFVWPELVAHASRDTRLRAGDVLGSGTLNGGCLLELGPLGGARFLEPGDVVSIEAQGLGRLETRVE